MSTSQQRSCSDRDHILREHGRLYGELKLAVAFTDANTGDEAKKCRAAGWPDTKPLRDPKAGADLLGKRGRRGNPVVVLRPSGLVGVESDTQARLDEVEALGLPDTVTVQSSEEYKRHFWFRPPKGEVEYVAFRFEEARITADRERYLLAPPARHPSGREYAFLKPPQDIEIATLPQDAYDELVRLAGKNGSASGPQERFDVGHVLDGATAGERDESAFKYASSLRARNVEEAEARVLMQAAWEEMEQPDGDVYPLDAALEKVERAWREYDAGPGSKNLRVLPPPGAPLKVARVLLRNHYDHGSEPTLRHWRGGWHEWHGSRWVEVENRTVERVGYEFTENAVYPKKDGEPQPWSPKRSSIDDLLDALAATVHLRESVEMPSWLDGREYDGTIVAVENGLLEVTTRALGEHTPLFFNSVGVPFDYEPGAAEPRRWLSFLRQLWPEDRASIATLQEWFGYVISGRTDLHKILLMVGPTRAGKGVISRILGALIGRKNVAAPTLSSLQKNFGLQPLLGKALATVADVRLSPRDATTVVERLLSISGEDLITVDRKYRDPWTGQMPVRFMLLSNELPQFGDASGAIANRFITLTLSQSFLGREDHGLERSLYDELPGILNWALDGLAQLSEQQTFTRTATTDEVMAELTALASPVAAFVSECCTTGQQHEIPCDTLYDTWAQWALENGHAKKSNSVFGRDLRAVVNPLSRHQRGPQGAQRTVYVGIDLTDHVKQGVTRRGDSQVTIDFSRVRRPK